MKRSVPGSLAAIALLSLTVTSCSKDVASSGTEATETGSSADRSRTRIPETLTFYALAGNTLDKYTTADPEQRLASLAISGLQDGERVLGIDFRPRTGDLYALGSNSRVYKIDVSTGAATFAFAFTTGTGTPLLLSGTSFGFDFNPQVDRLRIISNTGQNLRIVPDNAATGVAGTTFVDATMNPQPANVSSVAYDNNFAGTPSTELFALDAAANVLYEIDPPNAGTLIDPLPVSLKIEGDGGFDIAPRNASITSDIALALYEVNKKPTLFHIDVETGSARVLAKYTRAVAYTGLAISPAP